MEAGNGQDRIMAVAAALFAEAAFDKVTVQRICERAGVANGSFFRAFATKQALAAGLYGEALRTRDQVVADALAGAADDAAVAVRSAVRALLGFLTSGSPKARLLRRLREAMSDQAPFQADPDGMAGLGAVVEAWLASAPVAAQVVRLPSPLVATLLLSPVRAVAELVAGGQITLNKQTIDQLADRVWAALRADVAGSRQPTQARAGKAARAGERDLFSAVGSGGPVAAEPNCISAEPDRRFRPSPG